MLWFLFPVRFFLFFFLCVFYNFLFFFFFQAEDGIRDRDVTGVQTCALPISPSYAEGSHFTIDIPKENAMATPHAKRASPKDAIAISRPITTRCDSSSGRIELQIGRASCRERV